MEQLKAITRHIRPLLQDGCRPVVFIGRVASAVPLLFAKRGIRKRDFLYYLDLCGAKSLYTVLLICFLTGMILAVNGQIQLSKIGTEIFVVDLVGFLVLKELGPIMVAMVATGRAGSAFAAEIGTMKIDEEINALQTLGIRPESYLVMPKLAAMLISLPILTIFGDAAALAGGATVGVTVMKIPLAAYWSRSIEVLDATTFLLGAAKSVVFAILITLSGCYYGFNASNDALGVGRGATSAVVSSIFLVVIADAVITILYSFIGH